MITSGVPGRRSNHALGATALLFAALAGWPWLVPPVPQTRPLAAPPTPAATPAVAALPPLATFAATVERPLFSPSRRPAPGVAATGSAVDSRYRLLGIVASGPKKTAFVADGSRRAELAVGDTLDGWTVKEIGQDRVTLVSAAGEIVVKLKPAPPEAAKPQ